MHFSFIQYCNRTNSFSNCVSLSVCVWFKGGGGGNRVYWGENKIHLVFGGCFQTIRKGSNRLIYKIIWWWWWWCVIAVYVCVGLLNRMLVCFFSQPPPPPPPFTPHFTHIHHFRPLEIVLSAVQNFFFHWYFDSHYLSISKKGARYKRG